MRDFHDNDHANNRLSRCYLAFKKADGKWGITRIASANKKTIHCTNDQRYDMKSEDIKILFPDLGYVNTEHQCAYYTRSSKRMWKVGLTPENFIREFLFRKKARAADDIGCEAALEKLVNGVYPSAKKALKLVQERKKAGVAFSRKFCFGLHAGTKAPVLYYKNKYVGYYDEKLGGLVINDNNSHIIQQLLEAFKGADIKVII